MGRLRKVLLVGEITSLTTRCQSLQIEERESWFVKFSSGDRCLIKFILAKDLFSIHVGQLSSRKGFQHSKGGV